MRKEEKMCDNNNDHEKNEPNRQTEKDDSSSGCLTCSFFASLLIFLIEVILWIVWMVQGRPDNWFGKIFRLYFKVSVSCVIFILICIGIYGVICLVDRLKTKKNGDSDEEKR